MGKRLIPFPTCTAEVRKGEESNPNPILTTTPLGVWGEVRTAGRARSGVRKTRSTAGTGSHGSALKIQAGCRPAGPVDRPERP
jgi:hypothetical protein